MQDEIFLSSKEVKAMLKLSDTTLWRLRKSGQIPFIEFGSVIRYPKNRLLKWLNKKADTALQNRSEV